MVIIVGHLIISTHHFQQVAILKFGQGASARVKGGDILQGHLVHGVSGHQVMYTEQNCWQWWNVSWYVKTIIIFLSELYIQYQGCH